MVKVWTIKIAGPAGTGIKSAGNLLSQILNQSGYFLKDYSEYPSLVRGGHNTYQISFSSEAVFAVYRGVDLMVSLQTGHWQEHQKEFNKKTILLTDNNGGLNLPLTTMCTQLGGKIYANMIALGVICFLLDVDQKLALKVVKNHFGQDEADRQAFELGWKYGTDNFQKLKIEKVKKFKKEKMIVDGNEAVGWGLYKAGLNLFAAYPMTPATGLLHFLAKNQDKFKIRVIHPEDEIAAAAIACGASMAGGRSATGTSGGGFALMTESVSLAGAAELGVVFYLSQRPGPATGMPTWTSQGDLLFAVNAGHGEFPKIVLAPGDQREAFELRKKSLNLANKFDVPVILISDKNLSESSANIDDLAVEKMEIIESKKAIPGKGQKIKLYNSYEHDEAGFSVEEANKAKINARMRLKKIEKIKKFLPKANLYGSSKAKKLIVCWGSVKGAVLEAIKTMRNKEEFAVLQIVSLWPLEENLEKIINSFSERILIENNAFGQLGQLLKSIMKVDFKKRILKYDGRPFFPEEIKGALE
jgi:2-oxoglutarate ferredoxin oxidoreductase subunit alpha